jgi:hypothetical protein
MPPWACFDTGSNNSPSDSCLRETMDLVPSSLAFTLQRDMLSGPVLAALVLVVPVLVVPPTVLSETVGIEVWVSSLLKCRYEWVSSVHLYLLHSHWSHLLHLPGVLYDQLRPCYASTNHAQVVLDDLGVKCHLCYGIPHLLLSSG